MVSRASVIQQNTQRPAQFEITGTNTADLGRAWISARALKPADLLFPTRLSASPHVSHSSMLASFTGRLHRPVSMMPLADTHTMRCTDASLIYRSTNNLHAVQLLLGHTKLESTVPHLEIEVDDALKMAAQTEV